MKFVVFGVSYSWNATSRDARSATTRLEPGHFEVADGLAHIRLALPHRELAPLPGPEADGERRLIEDR